MKAKIKESQRITSPKNDSILNLNWLQGPKRYRLEKKENKRETKKTKKTVKSTALSFAKVYLLEIKILEYL